MQNKIFFLKEDKNTKLYEYLNKDVIFLNGDLASGKTTLVANIVKKLCQNKQTAQKVSSPTFSLLNIYNLENMQIFHYDFYQKDYADILANGLFENFFEKGLHFIEWGDEKLKNLLKTYDISYLTINISKIDGKNDERKYEIIYE